MEREKIIDYINQNNIEHAEVLKNFLKNENEPYSRNTLSGHITGSAFIINNQTQQALLISQKI